MLARTVSRSESIIKELLPRCDLDEVEKVMNANYSTSFNLKKGLKFLVELRNRDEV